MRKVVIFGDTSFAGILAEYIHSDTQDTVVAFTVDPDYIKDRRTFENLPLVPFDQVNNLFPANDHYLLVALSAAVKRKHYNAFIMEQARVLGYPLYSFVHSSAFVAKSATLGENVLIFPQAIIEPRAIIHDGVIVRSGAYVSHETEIGAYSYLAPRVAFSGNVVTGKHCFFGTNCTIRDRLKIGHDVVVGAGAVVLKDLNDKTVIKASEGQILDIDRFKLTL